MIRLIESMIGWMWRGNPTSPAAILDGAVRTARRWIRAHPTVSYVEPRAFSGELGLETPLVLAALRELEKLGEGVYTVVVRDSDGSVVRQFDSFKAVPATIDGPWGGVIESTRANTELIFEVMR